jgi:hypothetical protein
MGNFKSRREGGVFDGTVDGISREDAEQAVQAKLDTNTLVKESLKKMGKTGTDLGHPEGLLHSFLTMADAISYVEPTVEELIAYEKSAGEQRPEEEQYETPMEKIPYNFGQGLGTSTSHDSGHVQVSTQGSKSNSGNQLSTKSPTGKVKKASLKIKLVITELPDNTQTRKILSPVLATLRLAPQFGLFHSALIIGPWKIEWNNSSLIVPRKCMASAVVAFDLVEINGEENIKDKLQTLAEAISEYNVTKSYDQMNCNCQQFVDDLCKRLELPIAFKGQMAEFMDRLRKTGKCESKYTIPQDVLEKMRARNKKEPGSITFTTMPNFDLEQTSGEITFTSHEQLDEVVNNIVTADAAFLYSAGKDDYKLLKAFDRAFWLRHFKHAVEKKCAHDDYKPLGFEPKMLQSIGRDNVKCPFQDPTLTGTNWKR